MIAVLFVCLGNICRSPAAEHMLVHLNKSRNNPLELHVESCGIGSWHVGHLPCEEMRIAAENRGVSVVGLAKQFQPDHFYNFDYIFTADKNIQLELLNVAGTLEQRGKVHLFTEYSQLYHRQDVPDPFALSGDAFEIALDMIEESCEGILDHLSQRP